MFLWYDVERNNDAAKHQRNIQNIHIQIINTLHRVFVLATIKIPICSYNVGGKL